MAHFSWNMDERLYLLSGFHGWMDEYTEEKAKEILMEEEINIYINLNSGDASAVAWGCDLTYDYVKINGDYRS